MSGNNLLKVAQTSPTHRARLTDLAAQLFLSIGAAVLLFSSLRHFLNQYSFQQMIIDYHAVPNWASAILAGTLPAVQLLLAAAWFQGFCSTKTAMAISCLLLSFALLHWITLARGIQTKCGCFGETGDSVTLGSALTVSLLGMGCATATVQLIRKLNTASARCP